MRPADRYLKIVEWSDEDNCYIGRSPGLMLGGVQGDDEVQVYRELCEAVEEWIEIYQQDGAPLPPFTAPKEYSGKFMLRLTPELHERLAIRALIEGDSLNNYCKKILEHAGARLTE
ncbi:MAG: toxin-antitoxin system HicB family antitoxin [Caldilineaceae bacterium]|nr:toxin-antitoxin system HicB family antitoxin [Caldilineaceae bacterium]